MMVKLTLTSILIINTWFSCAQDSIAFLALGDSYTAGTSVQKTHSWPFQLVQILNKRKVPTNSPTIVAQPGWTTTDLMQNLAPKLNPSYDLVSLLIGVNNQYKGKSLDLFKKEFPELLDISIKLAKNNPKNVVVLSIPDWSVTPFARFKDKKKIVAELKTYNEIIETECKLRGVNFVEITKMSRSALVNPALIASDSLHPSKKMYKVWAKKVSKQVF
ncbi:SGNH/GDSL hydrolase family protein [Flagellimonas nanhaiensis]|uniref:SGNH/GDSL hydrolase family protein n=1 Tax=Flagellimonas nanhaiensis TaxID=2292706 RepID=A0A371JL17_9FLAO|nr:SGNH/GDSL hydrolase family protein [Allomuricauda nanhaiensis]RDY57611.1 SGNH/GDSL hydrolase family protein [Allomuricauda nanhaiensis]